MKIPLSLSLKLSIALVLLFSKASAQNQAIQSSNKESVVQSVEKSDVNDGKIKMLIMEDVLFQGIVASNETELIDKKVARVNKDISNPLKMEKDIVVEEARKTALLELKKKLEAEKRKLSPSNSKTNDK